MRRIQLTGLAEFGLDGEYELEPQPNTRELTRFRKEAGISPSELTEILSVGSLELLPLYVYTALQRQGKGDLASRVLDVPFDLWTGADTTDDAAIDGLTGEESEEDETNLPPTPGSGDNENGYDDGERSGLSSLASSALPA